MSSRVPNPKTTDVEMSEVLAGKPQAEDDTPAGKPLLWKDKSGSKHDWPTAAKPVKQSLMTYASTVIIDLALLALSVAFLVFALVVRHYDHATVVDHPKAANVLSTSSEVGPSIFPLLFAAVIGRAAHAIMLWRLEKGERVGTLDLLAGSSSLTSTVMSQIQLRIISILGAVLIAIWALSPIGGQASLQQLNFGFTVLSENASISYMRPSAIGNMYGDTRRLTMYETANAVFLSSFYSPASIRNSSLDLWGNVKVPLLEVWENTSTPSTDGWFDVGDAQPLYASLMGVPLTGYDGRSQSDLDFNIETSYLHLNCSFLSGGSIPSSNSSSLRSTTIQIYLNYNGSCGGESESEFAGGVAYINGVNLDCGSPQFPDENTPRNFTAVSSLGGDNAFCTITTTYVEMDVNCRSDAPCRATRLRRSQLSHPPAAHTVLEEEGGYGYGSPNGSFAFVAAGLINSITAVDMLSPIQMYLTDPDRAVSSHGQTNAATPIYNQDIYAVRLGQLFNTFYTALSSYEIITGGPQVTASDWYFPNGSSTVGTRTQQIEVILCNHGWTVALVLSSAVLIAACILHLTISLLLNRTPDVMLNISSLAIRDNPYVDVPNSGTAMDASERARLCKDMKVRFGDVEFTHEVGRLAIASVGTKGGPRVGKARKGRFYL